MDANNNDECLEYNPVKRYNDNTSREIIHEEFNIDNIVKMPIEERNKIIKEIYQNKDTSIR